MSDVVDLYAALNDDEAWWDRPRPPVEPSDAAGAAHPSPPYAPAPTPARTLAAEPRSEARPDRRTDPRGRPVASPDGTRGSLRGIEGQLALEALGALVADTHLRREHWELAQRAHRRHDNRSCLEDCLAVLAIDPDHREARKLGAKAARDLRQWADAAALLAALLREGEPAGQLDWDRIVAATVVGDDEGVDASVARLGLDPCTWQHPEALILVMLDGRAQVARRIGPAAAEILSIAAGDRPQHVGDVVAFDPTPLQVNPIVVPSIDPAPIGPGPARPTVAPPVAEQPGGPQPAHSAPGTVTGENRSGGAPDGLTFAELAAHWPPPAPGTPAAPLPAPVPASPPTSPPTSLALPETGAAQAPVPDVAPSGPGSTRPEPAASPATSAAPAVGGMHEEGPGCGSPGTDMPSWPTFKTLAILASGARQAWIVKGVDPGFAAWEDTAAELRERGWVLRRVPPTDSDADDCLGVVALPAALDPAEVRAALRQATASWPVPPHWQN